MAADAESKQSPLKPVRWVTSPHNRPRCPVHDVPLYVRSGVGEIAYLRCPVDGCEETNKCKREPVQELEGN